MNLENSQNYYGEVLGGSSDLRTDACCTLEAPPLAIRMALGNVHDEVKARYYGCGLVVPQAIEGAAILDLGSGAGQDAYLLAQMVGEQGSVTGIDATAAQLAIATRHLDWHSKRFGYARSNVRFVEGDIERLDALDLTPASFDAIVSNCVINLVTDKAAVLRAASGLLKPGGELYFSDVYAERRVPEALRSDPVLHGECLSGALYWGDFTALAKGAGFADPRLVTSRPLAINDGDIAARLAGIAFIRRPIACSSSTRSSRSARITGRPCAIPKDPRIGDDILLDAHHAIEAERIFPVCGNTHKMLAETRFAEHFDFFGDFSRHYGVFAGCGVESPFLAQATGQGSAAAAVDCAGVQR